MRSLSSKSFISNKFEREIHSAWLCPELLFSNDRGLLYQYCCKKLVHWKHWILRWKTGRGRCAHLCSGTCFRVSSITSDHLHCMHLWESKKWITPSAGIMLLFSFLRDRRPLKQFGETTQFGKTPKKHIFQINLPVSWHGKICKDQIPSCSKWSPVPCPASSLPDRWGTWACLGSQGT